MPKPKLITDEDAAKPIVYVYGIEESDWLRQVDILEAADYYVINAEEDRDLADIDLRSHLAAMCGSASFLALPTLWWTEVTGHQLVQIAGWLGMPLLSETADPIETLSLKSGQT